MSPQEPRELLGADVSETRLPVSALTISNFMKTTAVETGSLPVDAALFKRLVLTLKMCDLIEDEAYLSENVNIC